MPHAGYLSQGEAVKLRQRHTRSLSVAVQVSASACQTHLSIMRAIGRLLGGGFLLEYTGASSVRYSQVVDVLQARRRAPGNLFYPEVSPCCIGYTLCGVLVYCYA
jgi:hypothetical protein